mmetsp:Transcript_20188/g.50814  ORF Transcript_20188/g.50814 Transcript_20188/m.50814 type:complete len:95 (+) Transcript_20188:205-489(+)
MMSDFYVMITAADNANDAANKACVGGDTWIWSCAEAAKELTPPAGAALSVAMSYVEAGTLCQDCARLAMVVEDAANAAKPARVGANVWLLSRRR